MLVYKYGFEEYWENAKGNPTPENLETLQNGLESLVQMIGTEKLISLTKPLV